MKRFETVETDVRDLFSLGTLVPTKKLVDFAARREDTWFKLIMPTCLPPLCSRKLQLELLRILLGSHEFLFMIL